MTPRRFSYSAEKSRQLPELERGWDADRWTGQEGKATENRAVGSAASLPGGLGGATAQELQAHQGRATWLEGRLRPEEEP